MNRPRFRLPSEAACLNDLLSALRRHDPYTAGHSKRVSAYGGLLASVIGLDEGEINLVRAAGLAHDVGKLALPPGLLTKPGGLSDEEFADIQAHTVEGAGILSRTNGCAPLVPFVLHHHEHWNGRGYPTGLSGVDIPLASRLILVADAFDAMTTTRPYDPRISTRAALAEIRHCSGQQFDPLVVEAIEQAVREGLIQQVELAPAILL